MNLDRLRKVLVEALELVSLPRVVVSESTDGISRVTYQLDAPDRRVSITVIRTSYKS